MQMLWLPGRNAPIDYLMALRGVAVIGVLLGHFNVNGWRAIGTIVANGPDTWARHDTSYGLWPSLLETSHR